MSDRLEKEITQAVSRLVREDKSMLLSREDLKRILREAESRPGLLREDIEVSTTAPKYTDIVKSKAADGIFRTWVNGNRSDEIAAALAGLPDSTLSKKGQGSDAAPGNSYSLAAWTAFGQVYVRSIAEEVGKKQPLPNLTDWTSKAAWTVNIDNQAIKFEGTLDPYKVSFFAGERNLSVKVNIVPDADAEAAWYGVQIEGDARPQFPSDQEIWSAAATAGDLPNNLKDLVNKYTGRWKEEKVEGSNDIIFKTLAPVSIFPGGRDANTGKARLVTVKVVSDDKTTTSYEILVQPAADQQPAEEASQIWSDQGSWLKPTPWPALPQITDLKAEGLSAAAASPEPEAAKPDKPKEVEPKEGEPTKDNLAAAARVLGLVVTKVRPEFTNALNPGLLGKEASYLSQLNKRVATSTKGAVSISPTAVSSMRDQIIKLEFVISPRARERGSNTWINVSEKKAFVYWKTITDPPPDYNLTELVRRIFDSFLVSLVSNLSGEAGSSGTTPQDLYGQYLDKIFDQGMIEIVTGRNRSQWLEKGNMIYRVTNTVNAFTNSPYGEQSKEDYQYALSELAAEGSRTQNLLGLIQRLDRDFGSAENGFNEICRLSRPSPSPGADAARLGKISGMTKKKKLNRNPLLKYQRVLLYLFDCSNPQARAAIKEIGNVEGTRGKAAK